MSSNSLPIPLNTWRQVSYVYSRSEDTKEQGDDGTRNQEVAKKGDTTLKGAMDVHKDGLSTCSLGVVEKYLEAVKKCCDCDRNGETDLQGTQAGDLRVRRPTAANSAPDAELMRCTLLDLLDVHKDNRATMSLDECRDIISFLHGYVFPIVPQVTHSKTTGVPMTVHVYEKGIVSRVERCPYYNPRGVDHGAGVKWKMDGPNEDHIDGATMGRTPATADKALLAQPKDGKVVALGATVSNKYDVTGAAAVLQKAGVENFESNRFQPY